ncbi:MAG: glycogen synthase GlgA [Candidatus Bipolaricaulia bacterium]
MNGGELNVLMVASEGAPFAKTGGLADVVGALPEALHALGHDIRVMLPYYRMVSTNLRDLGLELERQDEIEVPIGGKPVQGTIYRGTFPDTSIPTYFVAVDRYYDRDELYGEGKDNYPDNLERFVFLDRAALGLVDRLDWVPDVIHCHDWQTALIPVYLKTHYRNDSRWSRVATLYTIHNLAYQGTFDATEANARIIDLDPVPEALLMTMNSEMEERINLMAGGIRYVDLLNTVSERYSREIQTKEYGAGLHEMLAGRADDLYGVLNGVDYDIWNPATDPLIPTHYDRDRLEGKRENKRQLQRENRLVEDPGIPLIGAISRLAGQKGFDLVVDAIDEIVDLGAQFVLLGTGDSNLHRAFEKIADRHVGAVGINLEYNERKAHEIEAGSDMFLMPSRYEPCGLNQMYSLRYGTVPIVRATGGLDDTIQNYDPATGVGNGFKFHKYTKEALLDAVRWALEVYRSQEQETWRKLMIRGMEADHSWSASAGRYVALYERAIAKLKQGEGVPT